MKHLKLIFLFCLLFAPLLGFSQQGGVGKWREHYSYNNVLSIVVIENEICGVTENGLFYYDKIDRSVRRKTTIQGLSGVGLSASNYDPSTQTQIIGYQNGNIDLIQNGRVYNIPDLLRKEISGSKKINKIVIENSRKVYLCCDFGIIVLNLIKQEISETYFIGINNSNVQVNDLTIGDSTIYAATNNGLLSADRFSNRLNNFSEWREIAVNSRTGLPLQNICLWNQNLIVRQSNPDNQDTIWRYDQHQWHVLDSIYTRQIKVSKNRLFQLRKRPDRDYLFEIWEYDADFRVLHKYGNDAQDMELWSMNDVEVDSEHTLWFSTGYDGLDWLTPNWTLGGEILPSGPVSNSVYALSHSSSTLYSTRGAMSVSGWSPGRVDFEVNILREGNWRSFENKHIRFSSWLMDAIAVAEDPLNPNVFVVGAYSSGVVQSNADGSTTIYNDVPITVHADGSTTVLNDSTGFEWTYWEGQKESIRIGDVKFDKKNQLWATHAFVDKQLHKRTPSGKWTSYKLNVMPDEPREFIIDYYDQLWIRSRWNGLVFFRETATGFDAVSANLNQGNEQGVSFLNCLVEDQKGYVWLGTDRGILVNYTSRKLFENPNGSESSVEFKTVICEGRPLLENENVTAIAVDGADRKWIGTSSSGVFLISADGREKIRQFNTENSPLNSNTITALAINPKTGEVYIGTDKGLMAYGGDASLGSQTEQRIVVFPNPVRADFTGEIGITGLVENAKVHITDVSGTLVFETTAKGGMATWNGKTRNGRRARPGVYIVFSTNADGTVAGVGKIFFNQ